MTTPKDIQEIMQGLHWGRLISELVKNQDRFDEVVGILEGEKTDLDKRITAVGKVEEIDTLMIQARDDRKSAREELRAGQATAKETIAEAQRKAETIVADAQAEKAEAEAEREAARKERVGVEAGKRKNEKDAVALDGRQTEIERDEIALRARTTALDERQARFEEALALQKQAAERLG